MTFSCCPLNCQASWSDWGKPDFQWFVLIRTLIFHRVTWHCNPPIYCHRICPSILIQATPERPGQLPGAPASGNCKGETTGTLLDSGPHLGLHLKVKTLYEIKYFVLQESPLGHHWLWRTPSSSVVTLLNKSCSPCMSCLCYAMCTGKMTYQGSQRSNSIWLSLSRAQLWSPAWQQSALLLGHLLSSNVSEGESLSELLTASTAIVGVKYSITWKIISLDIHCMWRSKKQQVWTGEWVKKSLMCCSAASYSDQSQIRSLLQVMQPDWKWKRRPHVQCCSSSLEMLIFPLFNWTVNTE